MTKILYKTLLASILISSASCSFYEGFKARREGPQIRVVDSQGKPRNVAMHTPQLNVDALSKQGMLTEEQLRNAPEQQESEVMASNKYANPSDQQAVSAAERELIRTLEMQPADAAPKEEAQKAEIGVAQENMEPEELQYDLGEEDLIEVKKKTPPSKQEVIAKGIFVQAGSFTDRSHAEARLKLLKKKVAASSKHAIMQAEVNGKTYYRVLFGPYPNKKKAGATVKSLAKKGYESIIVKN